jgi:phosphoribosylformylglycinamidine synthase II
MSRIEIAVKPELEDTGARHIVWEIVSTLGYEINGMRTVSVYSVYTDLSDTELVKFAEKVLCDPVTSIYALDGSVAFRLPPFSWAVEVSLRPGVTDNVGNTAAEVLGMMFGGKIGDVFKSTQYLIDADLNRAAVRKIGDEILHNSLIEEIDIRSYNELRENGPAHALNRLFPDTYVPKTAIIDLHVSDDTLKKISEDRVLALTLEEMRYFRAYFDREDVQAARKQMGLGPNPTDVELECFAQTQSEHCKHKIFNAEIEYREGPRVERIDSLFKTCIRGATEKVAQNKGFLVSVFTDNAGVIRFDDGHNLAFKVETHNSPSALDPYGGAITGIVGCDRDPAGTGIGTRIIAHTDVLCFGNPEMTGELPPRMMHPKRIMAGVVKGIEDGGNKCGIPTINGGILFDNAYRGKPLVFCGSVGIVPAKIEEHDTAVKEARPGDAVVMVGGKIGKDGIHGATFSSEEISETSPSQAVQIGDPITQKKMLDMLIEARDRLLYRGLTDNGAGGLSSSVGEMALLTNGARIELDRAPLKYPGLDPWEILLSEAQERMTLAVPKRNLDEFLSLAARRDVRAVVIGEFTDTGYFHVAYRGETVCFLDLDFLHSNIPLSLSAGWKRPVCEEQIPAHKPVHEIIVDMISDLNVCSREPVVRRYDHEVGGCTVVKPYIGVDEAGPSDSGVIAPLADTKRGFTLSAGINPFYSLIDTYVMAAHAVDEAVRNAVAVGADPDYIALLDNFCWPDPVYDARKNPDGKFKLAQLVRAARGLHDTAVAYGTPFISGKDSMKNDYNVAGHRVSVLPTVLVSALGIVPDVTKCVTSDFKRSGDTVYLLGETGNGLGGSLYYRLYGGSSCTVPTVDAEKNLELYRRYYTAVRRGLIASGHDLSEGGLAVSLAESCIGGSVGACIDISVCRKIGGSDGTAGKLTIEEVLFSEAPGRLLVSVPPDREDEFLGLMDSLTCIKIGEVTEDGKLDIRNSETVCKTVASLNVQLLSSAYRDPLYRVFGMKR